MAFITQRSREHLNPLLLLSCNFYSFNNFVTLASTQLRPPEDDADALKHVAVKVKQSLYRPGGAQAVPGS